MDDLLEAPVAKRLKTDQVVLEINLDNGSGESRNNDESTENNLPAANDAISQIFDDGVLYAPRLSVTERYFVPYYKMNPDKEGDDMCILIHSNKICMLALAPSHNVLRSSGDGTIQVDFQIGDKVNRACNKVSGKAKHGAQPLQETSNICSITCAANVRHLIKACVIGKLIEVNQALQEKPQLLHKPPHGGGYLAIVLLNIKLLDKMKQNLLTHQQYEEKLSSCSAR